MHVMYTRSLIAAARGGPAQDGADVGRARHDGGRVPCVHTNVVVGLARDGMRTARSYFVLASLQG